MKLVKDAYREWNAEVVFITSNYIGNSEMMQVRVKAKISCSPPCPVRRCRR